LGLHAGSYKKPVRDTAQLKQPLVEIRADFEQTVVNKVTDQWSKQLVAFVKTERQHFEHSLFVISRIMWTDEMF